MMESLKNIELCKKCNIKCGYNNPACRIFHVLNQELINI